MRGKEKSSSCVATTSSLLLTTGGRGEGRIGSFETKLENVLGGLEEEEALNALSFEFFLRNSKLSRNCKIEPLLKPVEPGSQISKRLELPIVSCYSTQEIVTPLHKKEEAVGRPWPWCRNIKHLPPPSL